MVLKLMVVCEGLGYQVATPSCDVSATFMPGNGARLCGDRSMDPETTTPTGSGEPEGVEVAGVR